jgi:hypothetical protein
MGKHGGPPWKEAERAGALDSCKKKKELYLLCLGDAKHICDF